MRMLDLWQERRNKANKKVLGTFSQLVFLIIKTLKCKQIVTNKPKKLL